jgi:hypothetical protein
MEKPNDLLWRARFLRALAVPRESFRARTCRHRYSCTSQKPSSAMPHAVCSACAPVRQSGAVASPINLYLEKQTNAGGKAARLYAVGPCPATIGSFFRSQGIARLHFSRLIDTGARRRVSFVRRSGCSTTVRIAGHPRDRDRVTAKQFTVLHCPVVTLLALPR